MVFSKYCLKGMLGPRQRNSLFKLFDVITELCAEEIDCTRVDELELKVHETLVCIERDFPLALQVIVFHLFHHLPMYVRRFVQSMDSGCTLLSVLIPRRVKSRCYPESTDLSSL